jgi:hypothetical protein
MKDMVQLDMEQVARELQLLKESDLQLEGRIVSVEKVVDNLKHDIMDIKLLLSNVATKDDINLVLRDALNSVPGKQTLVWTVASVIITVGLAIIWKH